MFSSLIAKVRIASLFSINLRWFVIEIFFIGVCVYCTVILLKSIIKYHYKNDMPELYFDIDQYRNRELNEINVKAEKIKKLNWFQSDGEHILTTGISIEDIHEIKDNSILYNSPKYNGKIKLVGIVKSTEPLNSMSIIEIDKKQSSYFVKSEIKEDKLTIIKIFNDRIIVKKDTKYFSIVLGDP